jgi:hypothetical protein
MHIVGGTASLPMSSEEGLVGLVVMQVNGGFFLALVCCLDLVT